MICYYNIICVSYSRKITHKCLSCHTTWGCRHIFVRVVTFWQRVYKILLISNVQTGVTVYHTLMIFSMINTKDHKMRLTKFEMNTLKMSNIIWQCKQKNPITLEQGCTIILRFCSTLSLMGRLTLQKLAKSHQRWWHDIWLPIKIRKCFQYKRTIVATVLCPSSYDNSLNDHHMVRCVTYAFDWHIPTVA